MHSPTTPLVSRGEIPERIYIPEVYPKFDIYRIILYYISVSIETDIKEFLITNRDYLSDITRHVRLFKSELVNNTSPLLHDDIKADYIRTTNQIVTDEISEKFAVSTEIILEILEEMEYYKYLDDE